jgi:hypothetical protein
MTCLKKLHLPAAAKKFGTRQRLKKPFLVTQNMVLISFSTTKCAVSQ